MSRFANLTNSSNDGFQVYTRKTNRFQDKFQDRRQDRFQVKPKEEKIITEEKFPQLSSKILPKKEQPILNYIEKAKIIPQEEEKKEIVKKEVLPEKEVLFTQEEA